MINTNRLKGTISLKKKKEFIFCITMLFLPLLQFFIFYICVNFNSFFLTFKEYKIDGTGKLSYIYVGFKNFTAFINDIFSTHGSMKIVLSNSLILYFTQLIIGVPISLLFSFYIYKNFLASKFYYVILFLPSIISSIAMCILYNYFVDRALPELLLKYFKIKISMPFAGDYKIKFIAILIFNIWSGFGFSILLYSNAMSRIPVSVIEASELDGVSIFKQFFYICIPLIYPTISTFILIGIAGIFTNQGNIYSFYQGGADVQLQTIGYMLFRLVQTNSSSFTDYPYAAAGGIILTAIAVPLTLLVRWLLNKGKLDVEF